MVCLKFLHNVEVQSLHRNDQQQFFHNLADYRMLSDVDMEQSVIDNSVAHHNLFLDVRYCQHSVHCMKHVSSQGGRGLGRCCHSLGFPPPVGGNDMNAADTRNNWNWNPDCNTQNGAAMMKMSCRRFARNCRLQHGPQQDAGWGAVGRWHPRLVAGNCNNENCHKIEIIFYDNLNLNINFIVQPHQIH